MCRSFCPPGSGPDPATQINADPDPQPWFCLPYSLIPVTCHIVSHTPSRGVEPDPSVGNVGLHLDVVGLDCTTRLAFHLCV
jgi:hypothetical protein